jgi:hypothetical protein
VTLLQTIMPSGMLERDTVAPLPHMDVLTYDGMLLPDLVLPQLVTSIPSEPLKYSGEQLSPQFPPAGQRGHEIMSRSESRSG